MRELDNIDPAGDGTLMQGKNEIATRAEALVRDLEWMEQKTEQMENRTEYEVMLGSQRPGQGFAVFGSQAHDFDEMELRWWREKERGK